MTDLRQPIETIAVRHTLRLSRSGITTVSSIGAVTRQLERELLDLINAYRTGEGRHPWRESVTLTRAARAHSMAMQDLGFFAHEDPWGRGPAQRVSAAEYGPYLVVGENIAMGALSPPETLRAWLDSPPHHALLLDRRVTEAGVGVAVGCGCQYWTLNCARPLPRPIEGIAHIVRLSDRLRGRGRA